MATKKNKAPRQSTADLIAQMRQKAESFGGARETSRIPYFRMKNGDNIMRIVLHPDYGIPDLVTYAKLHNGKSRSGKFYSTVNLSWLINSQELLERVLVQNKRFTPVDVDKVHKYGDPFDIIFKALSAIGKEDLYKKAGIGRHRAYFVVYAEGDFQIWETSKKIANSVIDLIEEYPQMLDQEEGFPIKIKRTGKGFDTSYSAPMPLLNDAGPIEDVGEMEDIIFPDPIEVIIRNTLSYNSKVEFACRSHSKLILQAGLDLSDFGVTSDEVKTTLFNGDDEDNIEEETPDDELGEES